MKLHRSTWPLGAALFACILASTCNAQTYTPVTATVTDGSGTTYKQGSYTINLVNTTGQPARLGGNTVFQQSFAGTLDANGIMNVNLPDVTAMTAGGQTGLQWKFHICANPSQIVAIFVLPALPCFDYTSTGTQISGASTVDISASLKAVAATIPTLASSVSYIGTQAGLPTTCTVGQLAFVTDATPAGRNLFQATSAGPPCTWTQPPDTTLSGLAAVFTNPVGGHVVCFTDATHLGNCFVGIPANNQTGLTYAVATGDKLTSVNRSNALAMSDTIAAAGSTGFPTGWAFYYENTNAPGGTNVTLTATTSTFVGAGGTTALTVIPQERCLIVSDGANWQTGCSLLGHDHSDAAHGGNIPPASVTGTAAITANVQIFTTSGTWTKPASAKTVFVRMVGGGGAGGAGFTSATTAGGGGGGAAGCVSERTFSAALLGGTETVGVGTGGISGGAAATASNFGNWLQASGGGAGAAGTATTAAGGSAGSRGNKGCSGSGGGGGSGAATNAGSNGSSGSSNNDAGGPGGGGASSNGTTTAAGGTGANGDNAHNTTITGGTAGTAGSSSNGGVGGTGVAATTNEAIGGAGAGGGGSGASGFSGGAGGPGSLYGGGGGGGGGGGVAGGAGGNGANGIVIIITYF